LGKRPGWGCIAGDVAANERRSLEHDFEAGRLKGLAATIGAGGVALTLVRASHALFVDLDWRPALNVQAEDRLVRVGQTANSVLIKRLLLDHPLDRHVMEVLAKKMRVIAAAVG